MHTRQVILKGLGAGFLSKYFAMENFFLGRLPSNKQFDQPGFDAAINNPKHPATISFRTRVRCLLEMLRIVYVSKSATVSTAVILFSNVVRVALEPVLNILCTRSVFHRDVYLIKDANITVTVSDPHCSAGRPSPHRAKRHASRDIARAPERVRWRAGLMGGNSRIIEMISLALSIARVLLRATQQVAPFGLWLVYASIIVYHHCSLLYSIAWSVPHEPAPRVCAGRADAEPHGR